MACCWSNRVEVCSFLLRVILVFNRGFRAAILNAGVTKGCNVLVTGGGGGVALLAVQLSVAKGANVFVTSGSDEKIRKLLSFGVKGGVNYKHGEETPLRFEYTSKPELSRRKLAGEARKTVGR